MTKRTPLQRWHRQRGLVLSANLASVVVALSSSRRATLDHGGDVFCNGSVASHEVHVRTALRGPMVVAAHGEDSPQVGRCPEHDHSLHLEVSGVASPLAMLSTMAVAVVMLAQGWSGSGPTEQPWSSEEARLEASCTSWPDGTREQKWTWKSFRETRTGAPLASLTDAVASMETRDDKADVSARLLDELGAADQPHHANAVARLIWQVWLFHDNPVVVKLMREGSDRLALGDLDEAEWRFRNALHFDPTYAEAWNKLATLHYISNDLDKSLAEIERTLLLEPRHFGALSGKGLVLSKMGNYKGAAEAMREAQEVFPAAPTLKEDIEWAEDMDSQFASSQDASGIGRLEFIEVD